MSSISVAHAGRLSLLSVNRPKVTNRQAFEGFMIFVKRDYPLGWPSGSLNVCFGQTSSVAVHGRERRLPIPSENRPLATEARCVPPIIQ